MAISNPYTVVKGDTLSEIAQKAIPDYYPSYDPNKYTDCEAVAKKIAELNNIDNINLIYVGQKLKISGTKPASTTNTTSKATIVHFGLQADTDRTIFATWKWDKANTKEYQTRWYYHTDKDPVWFEGSFGTSTLKQSVYNAPQNATKVKFTVKPISKTHKVNNKDTTYWTASWSTEKIYDFKNAPPQVPNAPNVTIEKYTLTAKLENIDPDATNIGWEVVKDNTKVVARATTKITTSYASYSCTIAAGSEYKVRCRALKGTIQSDWSQYSPNIATLPAVPSEITECKANSKNSVYLEWTSVASADTYDIQYTTKREYFDGSNQVQTTSGIETTNFELVGLEIGEEYFFRVRATNEKGSSGWSGIKSVVLGKLPISPTTWSSTTTVTVGEILNLYWVHNAEDGSSQTFAELELIIDGVPETHTIENTRDEDEKDKISVYSIDTTDYTEGVKIEWRVRTAGITKEYGDWSIQRVVDIYAPPYLSLNVTDFSGAAIEQLLSFPINVSAIPGPNTQAPIGYHLLIISNEMYETIDEFGHKKVVNAGEEIYSRFFDIHDALNTTLSANDVDLQNNKSYTITCIVTMDSGLTAEASYPTITVSWTDEEYWPNAELSVDTDSLTAYIKPYCDNGKGTIITNVYLSVYRREYDGSFTEVIANIDAADETTVTDPHPSLDYARYRIVAIDKNTGAVSFYDMPGYPIEEKCAVIQWNEEWSSFNSTNEDQFEQPTWSGSLIRIPYNIDVSENNKLDVSLVSYIGRKHPVSYYGTHLGVSSTWNMVIPKEDTETLYALRRLSIWTGDVYVREPSGSGYWASISVSFGQKHCEVTIPITLNIMRVEGGV